MSDTSFNLYERLAQTSSGQRILDRLEEEARLRDGAARQCTWEAEDGWLITYTTTRVEGGPHDGKFVTQAHKPTGPGARSGKATRFVETYRREFSTRKAAKARAEDLYRKHSPTWDAHHPKTS